MTTLANRRPLALFRFCSVMLLVVSAAANTHAAEIYVSPLGDDTAAGTQQAPLATIAAAQQHVRKLLAGNDAPSITVWLADGVYRLNQPLEFGPDDGGSGEQVVRYAALPGAKPVVSGGRLITSWRADDQGRWQASIPEVAAGQWSFRELFVGEQRAPRAQHPNEGYLRVVKAGDDRRTWFTFAAGDIPPGLTPGSTELLFLHDWSTSRVAVSEIDRESQVLRVSQSIGCGARHYAIDHFEAHARYRLENHLALLDAPGEWYLDTATGVLSYMPRPGETLEQFAAHPPVAPWLTSLVQVRGEPERPVRNLRFEGLHFAHCRWETPSGGYAAGQACFHEARDGTPDHGLRQFMPAAVIFELAEQCQVTGGSVKHCGGTGLWLGSRCHECVLEQCEIADIAGNGVMLGEDRSRRINGRAWVDAAPEQAATANRLVNCEIHDIGALYFGAVAVWVGMAKDTRVLHNDIHHTPYTGVSVGWMWNPTPTPCQGTHVVANHIHHVMQILSDGGGIYTLGRQPGAVLARNWIHDVPLNAGRAESNGMFLDQGTTEILIEANVIHSIDRSPLRFHQAGDNMVRGNLLATEPGVPIVRYNNTPQENIRLEENQVVEAKQWKPAAAGQLAAPFSEVLKQAGRTAVGKP